MFMVVDGLAWPSWSAIWRPVRPSLSSSVATIFRRVRAVMVGVVVGVEESADLAGEVRGRVTRPRVGGSIHAMRVTVAGCRGAVADSALRCARHTDRNGTPDPAENHQRHLLLRRTHTQCRVMA